MSFDKMKEHFRLDTRPVANPANIVQGDCYRITVLDAGLVRLEYSQTGEFEDRASQTVVNRAFAPCKFTVSEGGDRDGVLEINTERLQLTYDGGEFTTHGLSVQAKGAFTAMCGASPCRSPTSGARHAPSTTSTARLPWRTECWRAAESP